MTKRDILIFIFKWKATFFFGTLFVVAVVTALVYFMPQGYQASAKVLVERGKNPLQGGANSSAQPAEVQNTEIEILLSRPVMAAVVDKLKPYRRAAAAPAFQQGDGAPAAGDDGEGPSLMERLNEKLVELGLINQPPSRERWIARLLRGVKVKPVVDSNILEISYGDDSPEWAAKILNTVTDTYLAHRVTVYAARGASQFYKEQMDEAYATLQGMRERLSAFKTREGIPALDETRHDLVIRLGTLRERMTGFTSELSDLLSRYSEGHVRVTAQRQKMAALQRDVDAYSQRLLRLEQFVAAVHTQENEITSQEKAYSGYRDRYEERRMTEASNVDTTNARIVGYAEVPVVPASSRLFFIALSVVGGLFLSILISLIREYFDRRVNDPDVVERILGVPVLGSVNKFRI